MRLVKVKGPLGSGGEIMRTAFLAGIENVSFHQVVKHSSNGDKATVDVVDIETSTPKAHAFVDKLLGEDYFDRQKFSFNVREPRTIVSGTDMGELTHPLEVPPSDMLEELFQFTHITYGLVGRVFAAACLLAYGLIQQNTLLIIAGLLFLPLLPMLTAIGFGGISGNWRLLLHGLAAFGVCMIVLVAGGAAVASLSSPPLRYDDFPTLPVSMLITAGVGVAAGLAAIDDVGRRELIGLAAASQIGIVPAWLGAALVIGPAATSGEHDLYMRAVALLMNILMLLVGSAAVYWLSGVASPSLLAIHDRSASGKLRSSGAATPSEKSPIATTKGD